MRWMLVLLSTTACRTLLGVDEPSVRVDASADTPTDMPVDSAPLGPWQMPMLVTALSTTNGEDDPTLTADMLELYFATTRGVSEDIWRATRASVTDPFTDLGPVAELNTASTESNVDITPDGLSIVFASNRGGADFDLYLSTRSSRSAPWSTPALMSAISSTGNEFGSSMTSDRLSIVLCSTRDGTEALYRASRTDFALPFSTPVRIPELDTPEDDCEPNLPVPTTIYFQITHANGMDGMGGRDLYVVGWNGSTAGTAAPIGELNTTENETDPWVSPDQRTMFFASDRTGGTGGFDIYMAVR